MRTTLAATVAAVAVLAAACSGGGDSPFVPSGGDAGACDGAPVTEVEFDVVTGLGRLPEGAFLALDDTPQDEAATVCTTDWQGTPTVVNFWATWCEFCLEEMPDLQAASQELGDAVRFVGVDRQDNRDDALAFVERTGVTYEQVASPPGTYYTEIGARGMPTTLFVTADGEVVWRHTGPITRDEVLRLVDEHLLDGA